MSEREQTTRRTFLQGVGVMSAVGLAGCSLGANPNVRNRTTPVEIEVNRTSTPTPTPTPGGMPAPTEEAPPELAESATVEAVATDSGFAFEPSVVHVKPGATVTWEMVDSVHTVTAYHADNGKPNRMPATATPFDSGMLSEGETYEHTFESEGVYDYYCLPHEGMGMIASVVVGMPDPASQPGLAPPQESLPQMAREAILDVNKVANGHLNSHGGHEGHGGEGDDAASPQQPTETLVEEAEVRMVPSPNGHAFDPPVVQVAPGGSVTWTATDGSHCTAAYHPENDAPLRIPEDAEPWDSGMLEEGQSFTQTFEEPGIYDYFCPMHQRSGAVGTVVVGGLANQPGLAPPQGDLPPAAAEALSNLNRQAPTLFYGAEPSEKTIDASAEVVEGDITLFVTGVNGEVAPGRSARVVAWVDNHRLVNAPVTVNDEKVGTTDDRGALVVTLPTDATEVRIEAFAGVATGGTTLDLGTGSGAGNGNGSGGGADPEPLPQSVTIEAVQTADGYAFEPAVAHVAAGGTITWKMVDGVHTATAYATANGKPQRIPGGGTAWDSGILQPGDTYEETLGTEGVYDYYCLPHEGMGMVGTVVVGRPSADGQPGLAAPQGSLPSAVQTALSDLNSEVETLLANVNSGGSGNGNGGNNTPNQQPDQPSNGDPALPTDGDVTVKLVASGSGYAFDPPIQQIQPGQTVKWEIVDGTHNIEAYAPANDRPRRIPNGGLAWRSGMMGPGESFAFTIDRAGVYDYFCRPHEGGGMVGTLIVGSPTPEGQPGLAAPQSSIPDGAASGLATLNEETLSILQNGGSTGGSGGTTHTVTVGANGGNGYSPDLIHVDVGDTVRWELADGAHTVTTYSADNGKPDRIPAGASGFDSGFLSGSYEHTFTTAGKYDYYCLPHEGGGMVASVLVGSPDPATDPGFQPAQTSIDGDAANALDALTTRAEDMLAGSGGSGGSGGTGGSGGDGGDTGSGGSGGSGGATHTVTVGQGGESFTPDLVHVAVGDTVRWEWAESGHTVTTYSSDNGDPNRIPAGASGFDSGFAGSTGFEYTFTVEGKYDYYCLPHRDAMIGSVLVGSPDPATDPGLQPPGSGISGDAAPVISSLNTRAKELLNGGSSGGSGGSGDSGGDSGSGGTSSSCGEPVIDAGSVSTEGTIDIVVTSTDIDSGDPATMVARYDGQRLANAPVDVDGSAAGSTNACGELTFTVPDDDTFRIEIRVGDARGRTEVATT